MDTFTVAVVVDEVSLTDDELEMLFAVLPDAVPATVGGLVTVTSPVDGVSGESAALRLVDQIGDAWRHAVVMRLDQDLVAIPDIAERVGRSRESIRLLVEAKRGPGDFPPPVGTVGDSIRVWPWAVVLDWFKDVMGQDLDERGVRPEECAVVDACLAARRSARRCAATSHSARAAWRTSPGPLQAHVVAHTDSDRWSHAGPAIAS